MVQARGTRLRWVAVDFPYCYCGSNRVFHKRKFRIFFKKTRLDDRGGQTSLPASSDSAVCTVLPVTHNLVTAHSCDAM